jgi:hypothetical protein
VLPCHPRTPGIIAISRQNSVHSVMERSAAVALCRSAVSVSTCVSAIIPWLAHLIAPRHLDAVWAPGEWIDPPRVRHEDKSNVTTLSSIPARGLPSPWRNPTMDHFSPYGHSRWASQHREFDGCWSASRNATFFCRALHKDSSSRPKFLATSLSDIRGYVPH